MTWSLFQKIAKESALEPLLSTVLFELHNEPLLDKRIFDWVKYFKSMNPAKSCVIITNGELLDAFSLKDIIQSNLDRLVISLNAHSKDTYDTLNCGLDYDRVINNVSELISNPLMKQKLKLSFILTNQNVNEVHQAILYWNQKRIKTKVVRLTNRAGTLNNYDSIRLNNNYYSASLLSRAWNKVLSGALGVLGCFHPFYQMNILFNGDYIICCHDWNRATVLGNAGDFSLKEIWNSTKANEIRRLILRKRYGEISSCRECSIVK